MALQGMRRPAVFAGAFLAVGGVFSAALWKLAAAVKPDILGDVSIGLRPWVNPYFHPFESGLLNYLFLASGLAVAGLAAYMLLPRTAERPYQPARSAAGWPRWPFFLLISLIFIVLAVEPLKLFVGPVRLMNEYPEIFGTTVLDGREIPNQDFLSGVNRDPAELEAFSKANYLEYTHQVMGRGQINHIGHILNPLNEYDLGKPLSEVYLQYGLGNTLLFKLTMDLFGGMSIENYYKCYLYYLLYYALFLAMLLYVFRDKVYALCAFSAVAFAHFSYNYIGFVLAPGIIPTIHFLDAAMAMALAAYLKEGGWQRLLMTAFLASCAIFLNLQFGSMLAIAWGVALAVYGFEKRGKLVGGLFLVLPLLVAAISVRLFSPGSAGSGGIFKAYFSGYFSWSPPGWIVAATVLYFLLSYLFLLLARSSRSVEKYLYVFTFVYVQGLFVYFYWSGLINHLPIVFPFVTLQILLAAIMLERGEVSGCFIPVATAEKLKIFGAVAAIVLVSAAGGYFYLSYGGVKKFRSTFSSHQVYLWDFKRANLISTMDPRPLAEAAVLMQKYSVDAVAIISKYDNLLPFLAGRYSLMAHFEMPWYLISEERFQKAAVRLRQISPQYLFVDSDIDSRVSDPWALLYDQELARLERKAREGRLGELRALFDTVRADYKMVEKSPLIAVYKRIPGR